MIKIKKSVTLIEILVSSIIMAIVFGGVFSSFFVAREYVKHSNKRLMVTFIARSVFDDLKGKVRQDTWYDVNGPLYASPGLGGTKHDLPNYDIDGVSYGGANPDVNFYRVRRVAGRDYREVEITLNYPDD
ncbi:MAG: prepilin-type N-terminal cleavage/methylation domain-containing protein [Candidatus Omnitrophica bacterium]|nr:prepilin-type N-terminal cleavage/methylation domain-containing protein [Candidatus Omnitrophota bacterium]